MQCPHPTSWCAALSVCAPAWAACDSTAETLSCPPQRFWCSTRRGCLPTWEACPSVVEESRVAAPSESWKGRAAAVGQAPVEPATPTDGVVDSDTVSPSSAASSRAHLDRPWRRRVDANSPRGKGKHDGLSVHYGCVDGQVFCPALRACVAAGECVAAAPDSGPSTANTGAAAAAAPAADAAPSGHHRSGTPSASGGKHTGSQGDALSKGKSKSSAGRNKRSRPAAADAQASRNAARQSCPTGTVYCAKLSLCASRRECSTSPRSGDVSVAAAALTHAGLSTLMTAGTSTSSPSRACPGNLVFCQASGKCQPSWTPCVGAAGDSDGAVGVPPCPRLRFWCPADGACLRATATCGGGVIDDASGVSDDTSSMSATL